MKSTPTATWPLPRLPDRVHREGIKFLFTTLPSNDLGLLTRSLPIARELKNRGHEIAFCSPAPAPSKIVAEAGFANLRPKDPFYALISGDFSLTSFVRLMRAPRVGQKLGILAAFARQMLHTTAEIRNIDHFMALLGAGNKEFVQINVEILVSLIQETQPDVVVDFWNPFACLASRVARKPLITVIQADMHPLSRGFIWWREPSPNLPTAVPAFNDALAAFSLPPIQQTGELLLGDKTLVLGIPETDPLPAGAEVTYIGPVLWQKQDEKLPAWVEHLPSGKPLIWVYPGNPRYAPGISTAFDSGVVISACIEGLKDEPVQVAISTGHHAMPRKFLPLPANFHHAPYLPGLAMAGRSDLLIHHGGYGSCQTGLYTGTPALILPTYSERESNARRVAAVGAGEFLVPEMDSFGRKKYVNPETLRAKVWQLLSNPSYEENAMKIREKLRTYGGAATAAQLIETFLEGRSID
ncbi:MAG TPA: nucleotide disphospho-sugar-binding domain-containing protein [Anaerolineales bacterium]|nr:nucleotide disphospho-sugar-binding domain-containing protein [Anaerolineales bacterium]